MILFLHHSNPGEEETTIVAMLQEKVLALTRRLEEEMALRREQMAKEKALRRLMQQDMDDMHDKLANLTKMLTQQGR